MDMYQKRKIRKENKKNEENSGVDKMSINWYPGHMAKTKRQIKEKINLIDIVFEVLDARIPYSSKNKEIDTIINNKPKIIIMTKMDLCDLNETNKWKNYYEKQGNKVVLVDLINNKNINIIFDLTKQITKEINNKRKTKGLKPRKARILILGIPNVGKSTLINRLVGKKATKIGNKPGITKNLEWIRINNDLELLDTPGILWPKLDNTEVAYNLASTTAIKEEILNKEEIAIYIINKLKELYPQSLQERYKLTNIENKNIIELLEDIAHQRNLVKNNETDYERLYDIIMKDLREGYLGKITFDKYENR